MHYYIFVPKSRLGKRMEIKLIEDSNFNDAILIEGLPGIGLVGPMAVSYIIDKLEMKYVGYIESSKFPPIISIHKSKPLPPVRIYYSEKKKIAALFAEFALPLDIMNDMSDHVYEFFKSNKMGSIISIGGIPMKNSNAQTVFVVASNDTALKEARQAGLEPITEGVSTGISALLLFKSSMDNIPDTNILVPVDPTLINPQSAELAIKSINKLLKLNIDVAALENESKDVQAKIQEILKKGKETQDAHRKVVGSEGPSMYG